MGGDGEAHRAEANSLVLRSHPSRSPVALTPSDSRCSRSDGGVPSYRSRMKQRPRRSGRPGPAALSTARSTARTLPSALSTPTTEGSSMNPPPIFRAATRAAGSAMPRSYSGGSSAGTVGPRPGPFGPPRRQTPRNLRTPSGRRCPTDRADRSGNQARPRPKDPYRARRPSGVLEVAGRTKPDAGKRSEPRTAHRAIGIREKRVSFPTTMCGAFEFPPGPHTR